MANNSMNIRPVTPDVYESAVIPLDVMLRTSQNFIENEFLRLLIGVWCIEGRVERGTNRWSEGLKYMNDLYDFVCRASHVRGM